MKKWLHKIIVCPDCQQNFRMEIFEEADNEIKEGALLCNKCKSWYPISNFVPRIVSNEFFDRSRFIDKYKNQLTKTKVKFNKHKEEHKKTIETFDNEWKNYQTFGYKDRMYDFLRKTGLTKGEVKNKLVLDVGCGNGRYSLSASELDAKEVVGIDLIRSIDKTYRRLKKYKVNCIQADIFNLPFKKETFDCIFSVGVLHHTQNTEESFYKLPPLLKSKGKIACIFYRKKGIIREFTDDFIRFFTTKMPESLVWYLSYIPSTIATLLHPVPVWKKGKRWVKLDEAVFVTIIHMRPDHSICYDWWSPKIATRHTWGEVEGWYKKSPLKKIQRVDFGAVSFKAEKV